MGTSAQAADIKVWQSPDGKEVHVNVFGEIELDDAVSFEKQYNSAKSLNKRLFINLQSPGGNFVGGLAIAEFIHEQKLTTWVPADRQCASICAVMWLAGYERWATNSSLIGFHAAFNSKTGEQTGTGNAILGSYLTKWGYEVGFIAFATSAGPDNVLYLSDAIAKKYGLKFNGELPTEPYIQLALQKRRGTSKSAERVEPDPPPSTPHQPEPPPRPMGYWSVTVKDQGCVLFSSFKDGRNIGLGVVPIGVFALISKPSWYVPSDVRVAARVWIDNWPPLQGPGGAFPNLPNTIAIRVHPQYYRPLVGEMIDGWWGYVQFTGNEPPWKVSLFGVKAVWPEFEECARRINPAFVNMLYRSTTQPW